MSSSRHIAKDADGADDTPIGIPQGRGVERRRDHLAGGATRVEPGVASHPLLHHFPKGRRKLTGFLGTDEPRQRLLDHLVGAEAEQLRNGIVGLKDLAFEVGDEHGVGGVLDQALGVGPRLVQLTHVAEDADGADNTPVGIPQGRGVERRRDDLASGAAWVEPRVASHPFLHHLPKNCRELARLLRTDEPRQRLLDHLVGAEAEQLRYGIVGLKDLAFEVGDEHGVGGVLDQALGVGPRLVQLAHVAEDADGADNTTVGVPQGRRVERRRNHLARGATRVEPRVARHTLLHHLPKHGSKFTGLFGANEPRQRLLDHLVGAKAE